MPPEPTPENDSLPMDLRRLIADPDPSRMLPRRNLDPRNDPFPTRSLDDWLVDESQAALEHQVAILIKHTIRNTDRTVGARLAGEIARRYGDRGLPPGTIRICLEGSAGQSFGAFCIEGMQLVLSGEANDYVGKGMAGGEIIVQLPPGARWTSQENYILGNTVLYGATGGSLYAAGRAGERFCVRNSGATAVVEGVGDHACEYMTGGTVVVLGEVGRNFGAGMTGGVAYVLDMADRFPARLNAELVQAARVQVEDMNGLRHLIERHAASTGSAWSKTIVQDWARYLPQFYKVMPK